MNANLNQFSSIVSKRGFDNIIVPDELDSVIEAAINKGKVRTKGYGKRIFLIAASLVLTFALITLGALLFPNKEVSAKIIIKNDPMIEKMVVKSLPSGMRLNYREVGPNGVKLMYYNDEEPMKYKFLEMEILRPGSEIHTLKSPGQGSWLPPAVSKVVTVNNYQGKLEEQFDGSIPWLQLVVKEQDKIINVFSRGLNEKELIAAISSVSVSEKDLKDNKVIRKQITEIGEALKTIDLQDVNQINSVLRPYQEKGWTIKNTNVSGKLNNIIGIEINESNQTIKILKGNDR